ncbi:MAG: glycosyltransferase [Gammaproteobacteria bacterium]
MRIVIDMQGAQTESRFRGIGRYTLSFAQAIVRNRGEHEVILVLSGLFPETIETIRVAFNGLLPQENIRVWQAPFPVREMDPTNTGRREVAELIREAFLASLKPDVIHISSFFEGYADDAITSICRFDFDTPVSVTLHDLIPLLNPEHYLKPNQAYEKYYLRKIDQLKKAAIYLAVSESSRQEGLEFLHIHENRIFNTSEGVEDNFQCLQVENDEAVQLRHKFGLTRPFVLYTGGADERKNLPRLIKAFASLPIHLRRGYQLLLAGKISDGDLAYLLHHARSDGLKSDDLRFTGYVTDEELVQLYNLCELFVFPSWHEGFGLPALEAMACGAPVIGANTSSLPEVIGLDAALFDPLNVSSIVAKMTQVLEDDSFCAALRTHGLQQSRQFSWDNSARRAIAAFESRAISRQKQKKTLPSNLAKPRLAFVSPLPPERSGIADYSAELLPAMSEYYDIEVIVVQDRVDVPWVNRYCKVRDVSWLRSHSSEFDRILYQFGNSPFHQHMLPLLQEIPGTVVLHDFYMSALMAWLELHAGTGHVWSEELYASHGYGAVRARYLDVESAKLKYPVNFHILQHAQGIIVHSEYSRKLARQWYGKINVCDWEVIPLLRTPAEKSDKINARRKLGIGQSDFVVCSFGFLDSTKLNHCLLKSWLDSALTADERCKLIFVGENHGGDYGMSLLQTINESGLGDRILITGFVETSRYRSYLAAADMAVQLRTHSRGETSAAVLDCMNHMLPLIVNANGSMAEIDSEAVWMLPDKFGNASLIEALEVLWRDQDRRHALGKRAGEIIMQRHAPTECAKRYFEAIEHFYQGAAVATSALLRSIVAQKNYQPNDAECKQLAKAISATLPLIRPAQCLLLDVSATCRTDLKTGIERVVRALLLALLNASSEGYRVEPVYLTNDGGEWSYRYARNYTLELLDCPADILHDDIVEPECGDVLLGLDLSGDMVVEADRGGLFTDYRNRGVLVYFMIHDLLPIRMPEVFPPGADQSHTQWLQTITKFDGVVCVSKTTADDLSSWLDENGIGRQGLRPFSIRWSHHGADVANSAPSRGLPDNTEWMLQQLGVRPSFLMVGTVEPRKGYLQTIDAFTQLWNEGIDVNLVIVGKEGWKNLPDDMRRDIPETIERMRNHAELNKHLFWLEGISDEYLEKVYAVSTCLIAASYGEGFGLPLIEAAQHKLPIIARDIPVFREVAGENAFYFSETDAGGMTNVVKTWLKLNDSGLVPRSDTMLWLTWGQSAHRLLQLILQNNVHEERCHKQI